MKFLALIATAAAVRLNAEETLPTAAEVMAQCDKNKNGKLNFGEVKSCLK